MRLLSAHHALLCCSFPSLAAPTHSPTLLEPFLAPIARNMNSATAIARHANVELVHTHPLPASTFLLSLSPSTPSSHFLQVSSRPNSTPLSQVWTLGPQVLDRQPREELRRLRRTTHLWSSLHFHVAANCAHGTLSSYPESFYPQDAMANRSHSVLI